MKIKPKAVEITPEALEIDSEPIGVAVEGTEIIPARQTSVSEKDIATLNNYADKKLQESTQLSEVMNTVPSIVQRGGIYLISAAVGLTSVLLYFSKVPVWIESLGNIVPKADNITVISAEPGIVTAVRAKVGQRLAENATLLEIKPTSDNDSDVNNKVTMPQVGTVSQLGVDKPGDMIERDTVVATVIPDTNRWVVETTVSDRDIAAIKPEMLARIKVDAYDFREFGTIPAQVSQVTPNLERPGEFNVTLDLLENKLTNNGAEIALLPGLNVQVEMQTEKKRLLNLLFSKK